jgi:two-component system NtrC family sensor kinase
LQSRIFEPFFSTKKDKGTGIGLSVSYKIIQSHNGRIDVSSRENEGSTFTVVLPVV